MFLIYLEVVYDQVFLITLDIFPITSHCHSMSEDFEIKYSFELLLFRLISSKEDLFTLLCELGFLFFSLLLLFLLFTQNLSLERVYIPNISNCQSNFFVRVTNFLVVSLFQDKCIPLLLQLNLRYIFIYETYVSYIKLSLRISFYFRIFIIKHICCGLLLSQRLI